MELDVTLRAIALVMFLAGAAMALVTERLLRAMGRPPHSNFRFNDDLPWEIEEGLVPPPL